jgi:hypothetical protein
MRKVIVCNAVGEYAEAQLALSLPTFEAYGAKYDYQVFIGSESPADRSAHWGKISLLQSAVQEYDLVLWLDSDAMILDFSEDIADQIETDCFQALLMEQEGSRWNANTGVWLLKGGQQSLDFLNEVWELGPQDHPSWHDQAAVIKALGWSWSDWPKVCKITDPSPYLANTSWLAPEWNRIPLLYPQIKARIQHWAGGPDQRQKRIEEMGQVLEVMRGSGMLDGV